MKNQMWIKLRTVLTDCPLSSDRYSIRKIAIKNYDELTEWMERNKEMWQLVTVEVEYINDANFPFETGSKVNVRNVYYVFE